VFTYGQFLISIVSGFVLFPWAIYSIGAHDYGLWLATGELIGYVVLSDFGVLAALPWLVAKAAVDADSTVTGRLTSAAWLIGLWVSSGACVAGALASIYPFADPTWEVVRGPLMVVFFCTVLSTPLRIYQAVLVGVQDVFYVSSVGLVQSLLTVILTALSLLNHGGIIGLAWALGGPPILGGFACWTRVRWRYALWLAWYWPKPGELWALFCEGLGPWLASFGVRLLSGGNSIILSLAQQPTEATILATTAKIANVALPVFGTIPDSASIGLTQLHAEGKQERTQATVRCLVLMYWLLVGALLVGLMAGNGGFVQWWVGPNLYAGTVCNISLAILTGLFLVAGGYLKLVAAVAYRPLVGTLSLVYGLLAVGAAWVGFAVGGLVGMIGGQIVVTVVFALPCGLWLLTRVYAVGGCWLMQLFVAWFLRSLPALTLAVLVGACADGIAIVLGTCVAFLLYGFSVRPLLAQVDWPTPVRRWLERGRLLTTRAT
jgi:O-antigen/teichoic acid export membrane protein